ncbi:MAG: hypothetical protein RL095_552 [Verrucomicrobiota bacterium]|jgi:hypothetical protein
MTEAWSAADAAAELARLEKKKRRSASDEKCLSLLRDAFDPEACARLAQWFAAAEHAPTCSGKGAPVRETHLERVRQQLISEAQSLSRG